VGNKIGRPFIMFKQLLEIKARAHTHIKPEKSILYREWLLYFSWYGFRTIPIMDISECTCKNVFFLIKNPNQLVNRLEVWTFLKNS